MKAIETNVWTPEGRPSLPPPKKPNAAKQAPAAGKTSELEKTLLQCAKNDNEWTYP
jgi:hypothetical protein